MSSFRKATLIALLTILGGSQWALASDRGALVMVGGALASSNEAVYQRFIELAGGGERARIGIFPAASGKPVRNANLFREDLIAYGVNAEQIEIIPVAVKDDSTTEEVDESEWSTNGSSAAVVEQIDALSGVWFLGGDQLRITQTLLLEGGQESPALGALRRLISQRGGVLGGTSAGAAIMSEIMIGGGDSLGALKEGFTTEYTSMDQQEYGPVYIEKGLNFFPWGTIDQHFDRKARHARLIVICYENRERYPLGFGIDEDAALVVDYAGGTAQAIGRGGVTIIDVSDTSREIMDGLPAYRNVRMSFIQGGDTYKLDSGEISVNEKKYATVGEEYMAVPGPMVTGVFSRNALVKHFLGFDLVDNSQATRIRSYLFGEDGLGFELLFRQEEDTRGYWRALDGQVDNYSIINAYLDITPVKVTIEPLPAD
jgi:cyanophycinase